MVSVYDWNSDPAFDRRLYPLSNARAAEMVAAGQGVLITLPNGRLAIRKCQPREPEPENVRESAAATPFSKVPNPLRKPSALHYQVPACGDHRVSWLNRFMLPQVSG